MVAVGLEGPAGGAPGPGAVRPGAGVLLMSRTALAPRGWVSGSVLAPRGWVLRSRAPLEGAPGPGQGGGAGGSGARLCPGGAEWREGCPAVCCCLRAWLCWWLLSRLRGLSALLGCGEG